MARMQSQVARGDDIPDEVKPLGEGAQGLYDDADGAEDTVHVRDFHDAVPELMHEDAQSTPANVAATSSEHEDNNDQNKPPSFDVLSRGVRKLMETIDQLRQLGVEDYVAPLPKIVVVGDQSAGKSSVVEAVSQIRVPRSAGTCTRCPLEISLKRDEDWSCRVSLRQKYTYLGSERQDADNENERGSIKMLGKTKASGGLSGRGQKPAHRMTGAASFSPSLQRVYGRFVVQEPEDFVFMQDIALQDLEQVLKLAQEAILRPSVDPRLFVPGGDDWEDPSSGSVPLSFSPNIVRLEVGSQWDSIAALAYLVQIAGPSLPNLSFYDLPGIINRAADHELHLVSMVKDLAKEYIGTDNSLVLLAQSLSNDANVSSASELVEEMDAGGRCVGVLTKPDLIGHKSTYASWANILRGEAFTMKHGYFVTKQPDQDALDCGVTHLEARRDEALFFATREPWCSEFAGFTHLFGTERLQTALSEKLTIQIMAWYGRPPSFLALANTVVSIPDLRIKVAEKRDRVQSELQRMPDPPAENLHLKVHQQLLEFNFVVQRTLEEGGAYYSQFHMEWAQLLDQFRAVILQTRPELVYRGPMLKLAPTAETTPRHNGSSDQTPREPPGTPTPNAFGAAANRPISVADNDSDQEPSQRSAKKRPASPPPSTPAKKPKMAPRIKLGAFARAQGKGKGWTVQMLHLALSQGYNNGIPDLVSAKSIEQLCRQSVEHWEEVLQIFLDQTAALIKRYIYRCLDDHFQVYQETQLYEQVSSALDDILEQVASSVQSMGTALFESEKGRPATRNLEGQAAAVAEALEGLRKKRHEHRTLSHLAQESRPRGWTNADVDARVRSTKDWGRDEFDREVIAMGTVQGYYKIALNRFVDNVFLSVPAQAFKEIRANLVPHLQSHLRLTEPGAAEYCARLAAEDPEREIRRAQLRREEANLRKALECLATLSYKEDGAAALE
ncbi:MAG: hypothetical protein M1826_003459 [Phylliscum demangeonii]|nr:MAG: hypothetical protein M1826_003459 [Phylliscum demangeonii]